MLPRLIVIVDRFTDPGVGDRAISAAAAGAPWLMLRDREAEPPQLFASAEALLGRLQALGLSPSISVTAHVDVARALGTHLHLGKHDTPVLEARRLLPKSALIGYSSHGIEEAAEASASADYVFLSPIFRTTHRPGAAPLGLDALRQCAAAVSDTAVYALGGIDPARAAACVEAGAHGIAVLSGVLSAEDAAGAVRAYLEQIA